MCGIWGAPCCSRAHSAPIKDELLRREKCCGRPALLAAMRAMPPLVFRLPGPIALGNVGEAYIHQRFAVAPKTVRFSRRS